VADSGYVVDFPTLGFLAADWVAAHCVVPDGMNRDDPFMYSDWQLWDVVNHYRVKADCEGRRACYSVPQPTFTDCQTAEVR